MKNVFGGQFRPVMKTMQIYRNQKGILIAANIVDIVIIRVIG